jgi:hypothetical protein
MNKHCRGNDNNTLKLYTLVCQVNTIQFSKMF